MDMTITASYISIVILALPIPLPLSLVPSSGVQLILESAGDQQLPNITIVSADSIDRDTGLICESNDTMTVLVRGEWRGPDGREIQAGIDPNRPVYVLRAPLPTSRVTLYRTAALQGSYEGVYTCVIPDSNGKELTLYAGIYSSGGGKHR